MRKQKPKFNDKVIIRDVFSPYDGYNATIKQVCDKGYIVELYTGSITWVKDAIRRVI